MAIDTPRLGKTGPAPTDVSLLTRNRLWSWMVYCDCPTAHSWDALDDLWLRKIDSHAPTESTVGLAPRRRVFQRYFQVGNDPSKLRGINGRRLIDAVHADPSQREARAAFESEFWELAGAVEPRRERIREMQAQLMDRLGYVRFTPTQQILARYARLTGVTALGGLEHVTRCAQEIGDRASLDALALLASSYRLALDDLSLMEADSYLQALRSSLQRFLARWRAHHTVAISLVGLVELRLVRRTPDPVSPEALGFRSRRRRGRRPPTGSSVDPISRFDRLSAPAHRAAPIIRRDATIEAFLGEFATHYERLRDTLVKRLSESHATDPDRSTGSATDKVIVRKREELVDAVLLGPLNTHGEEAYQTMRFLALAGQLGGLGHILCELLDPVVEQQDHRGDAQSLGERKA